MQNHKYNTNIISNTCLPYTYSNRLMLYIIKNIIIYKYIIIFYTIIQSLESEVKDIVSCTISLTSDSGILCFISIDPI